MNSILLLGPAGTNFSINKIVKQSSSYLVKNLYGENSDLTDAFLTCKDITNAEIYLANVKTPSSYLDVIQQAQQFDFTYIVPIGIRFSDKAYSQDLNKKISYTEIFLRIILSYSESILIMTDNHASLYEDIDAYLKDMKEKIDYFKTAASGLLEYGKQLWFVSNQLKDVKYSNVLLAAVMSNIELPNYPNYKFPESVFDLDPIDVEPYEMIYFKNNLDVYNSVENLVNFYKYNDPYKIIMIDLIVKKINEELDFSSIIGKLFTNQLRLKIKTMLNEYLKSITGVLIRDFHIDSIEYYLTESHYYVIVNKFTILPINSLEEIEVVIEV